MSKKAVFVDRDNTLIDDPGYLADPEQVKLLPGADLAIKSLRQAGYLIVVITNQSGVARGMLTEEMLEKIHASLRQQLADKNAMLDAIYYCPFHPDGSVEKYARESDLRKPAPGMLIKASEELGIDLRDSWMVGDSSRDIGAGQRAGCRTIRVQFQGSHPATQTDEENTEEFRADFSARNLVEAARIIKRESTAQAPTPQAKPAQQAVKQAVQPAVQPADKPQPARQPIRQERETKVKSQHQPNLPKKEIIDNDDDAAVRKEILRHVRQLSRQSEHEEFRLTNLLGGIAQVLVGLFLLLVFYKALGTSQTEQAILWGIVAMVFQGMSLTFFMMSRKNG